MITLNDQWAKIQLIQNNSWRKVTTNNKSAKQYLVETIQRYRNMFPVNDDTLKQRFQNIVNALPLPNFWTTADSGSTLKDIFVGNTDANTPLQQFLYLSYRELIRIRDSFTNGPAMIDHAEFANDDLVRVLCLCGTFAKRVMATNYTPLFSGMLVPDQPYNSLTFKVHTCVHGFEGTDPITDFYFIPYGFPLRDEVAFRVQTVHHSIAGAAGNNNLVTPDQLQQQPCYSYGNSDYACAVINVNSYAGHALQQVFIDRQQQANNLLNINNLFTGFNPTTDTRLPNLLGLDVAHNARFTNFEDFLGFRDNRLKYYSVIGRPGNTGLSLNDSGFVVSVSLDNTYLPTPRIQTIGESDIILPMIGQVAGRTAQSYPSCHGMSGGIVLRTYSSDTINQRLCRPLGTVHGGGRVFVDNHVIDLNAFTSALV